MLEVDIQLLSFAHAGSHLIEPVEHLRQFGCRHLCQQFVCFDEHLVAGEDGGVVIPFDMDGLLSAPHRCAVHHVVVHECEVMEHLQGQSGRQHVVHRVDQSAVDDGFGCDDRQVRTETLTAGSQGVLDRFIQPARLLVPV